MIPPSSSRELASKLFYLTKYETDSTVGIDRIEAALEENAIVTSDEGTSYCRFCNQQAYRLAEAKSLARKECEEIANRFVQKHMGHAGNFDVCAEVTARNIADAIRALSREGKV